MKVARSVIGALRFVRTYSQHLPLAFESIFSLPCAVTRLRGTLKGAAGQVTVLYIGRRLNYAYLRRTLFGEHQILEQVHSTLLTFRRHSERMARHADVVIIDIGWPYNGLLNRRGDYLELPDWINMSVELPDEWGDVVGSFRHTTRNNDLRLIRRNDYRCVPTRHREDVERFYDTMYLPFINHKHEEDAVKATRRHVLRRASQGWLLQILKGDEIVSAGVVFPERGILYFLWMGMPEKYLEQPPEASISALYFFGIRHAFDNNCAAVDFVGTRPFLNDGAFRFKRKWGATVEDTFSPNAILIKPTNDNENAAAFCARFPMLARRDGRLEAIFLHRGDSVDTGTFERLDREYVCKGIDAVSVVEVSRDRGEEVSTVRQGGSRFRHVRSALASFARHYARAAPAENSGCGNVIGGRDCSLGNNE